MTEGGLVGVDLTEDDVEFEAMRSGGPGGQNVDRRATAVRLRIAVDEVPLPEEERDFLREHLPPRRLTDSNEIIVENAEHRSQKQNRRRALEILNREIEEALEAGRRAREKQKRRRRAERGGGSGGGGGEGSDEDPGEQRRRRYRSETTDELLEEAYREDPDRLGKYLDGEDDESEQSG